MKSLLSLLLLLYLAPASQAQQVWVVDDVFSAGVDFLDIQTAIDFAADGDVLLVHDGTYAGFSITAKSLKLVVEEGGTADVTSGVDITGLSSMQEVTLIGFTISDVADHALFASSNLGVIQMQSCQLVGGGFSLFHGALVEDCDSIAFTHCVLEGGPSGAFVSPGTVLEGGSGILSQNSSLYLSHCILTGEEGSSSSGGAPTTDGGDGGIGLLLEGGLLVDQGSIISGGRGGTGWGSLVAGCGDGGDGGVGLQLDLGPTSGDVPTAEMMNSIHVGGNLGNGGTLCADGTIGLDFQTLAGTLNNFTIDAADLAINRTFTSGQFGFMSVLGTPGAAAFIAVAPNAAPAWTPLYSGVLMPEAPTLYPVGTIPAWGILNIPLSLDLPGGSLVQAYSVQAVTSSSPGIFVLGAPATLVLLDARY